MAHLNTVMHELVKIFPRHEFEKIVRSKQTDRYAKKFKSWHHFIVLLYSQVSGKESLREIEHGLRIVNRRVKMYQLWA